MIPLEALIQTADYYIEKEHLFILDERQKVRLAIERLGLSSCSPFVPEKRIIEYLVKKDPKVESPLVSQTVAQFCESVLARTPTPGGGSVAALVAAMGAALGAMVGYLTYGKRAFEKEEPYMREAIPAVYAMMHELLPLVDEDTRAYDAVVAANTMPKGTPELDAARAKAVVAAGRLSIEVPLRVMRTASKGWKSLALIAEHGSINSRSDLEVGAKSLELGIWGAHRNVLINLCGEKDEKFKADTIAECDKIMEECKKDVAQILEIIEKRVAALPK